MTEAKFFIWAAVFVWISTLATIYLNDKGDACTTTIEKTYVERV
jgi:hypothetical protein